MNVVLVGHRGAGKSSLLKRIQTYRKGMILPQSEEFFDLDALIEANSGQEITQVFSEIGEAGFRQLERRAFDQLRGRKNSFIAVGAGFDLQWIAQAADLRILWVRRETDSPSKFFLDRPDLSDYEERFEARTRAFERISHEQLFIPEGWDFENESERSFFRQEVSAVGGIYTLRASDFRGVLEHRLEGLISRGYEKIELRDDLLNGDEILQVLQSVGQKVQPEQLLYSVRNSQRFELLKDKLRGVKCDWPLELGQPPSGLVLYSISLHERRAGELMREMIRRFEQGAGTIKNVFLKFAPLVNDFTELRCGHDWAFLDRKSRQFLPRSAHPDQNWRWYRMLSKNWYGMHFVNEGSSEVVDQPLLLDWLRMDRPQKTRHFGAVLGCPVAHSRTPATHWRDDQPVLPISVPPAQWEEGISFLEEIGMSFAAVTSPLKNLAAKFAGTPLEALNTLRLDHEHSNWEGINTDTPALSEAIGKDPSRSVLVFGGGGVLETIQGIFPDAVYLSARTLKPRPGSAEIEAFVLGAHPRLVVWAVPRGRISLDYFDEAKRELFRSWKVDRIFDLNYTDDSPGIEFAKITSAHYKNGREMFEKQAALQKRFW